MRAELVDLRHLVLVGRVEGLGSVQTSLFDIWRRLIQNGGESSFRRIEL